MGISGLVAVGVKASYGMKNLYEPNVLKSQMMKPAAMMKMTIEVLAYKLEMEVTTAVVLSHDSGFPEKRTADYYAAMAYRDRVFHGRRLAGESAYDTTLTFASGNTTFHISELGFLYYANVSVGTLETWFLVALDTGSHIFWLLCDCAPNCVEQLPLSSYAVLEFNMYSLRTSSTGSQSTVT